MSNKHGSLGQKHLHEKSLQC